MSGNGHIYTTSNGISKGHKTLDLRSRDVIKNLNNSRKRSKYKMLNPEIKRQAVNLVSLSSIISFFRQEKKLLDLVQKLIMCH